MNVKQENGENSRVVRSKAALAAGMAIFGTIGIIRKYIPLSSAVVSCARGIIGTIFLALFMVITKKKISREKIKAYLWVLVISGAMLGINWILLFEAYRYTTVATATLCYYMAPIFLILAAPWLFNEKLSWKKWLCVALALAGIVLVSGVTDNGFSGMAELKGVFFGLGAAVLYAAIIAMNKLYSDISPYDRTVVQLAVSAIVLIPYILVTEDFGAMQLTLTGVLLLAVAGVVHTGIAYTLYYSALGDLKAQTIALYSYIDPVLAIILSALFLHEPMTIKAGIGAVLVLGATLFSEFSDRREA